MKDYDWLMIALLVAVMGTALYLGVTLSLKKAFKFTPPIENDAKFQRMIEQKRRMDEIKQRQRELMRQQKQKIRDLQRL